MKNVRTYRAIFLMLGIFLMMTCSKDLTDINQNPNGIALDSANPNLLLPVVLGNTAQRYLALGFGDIAGVMQHTQKDGWFGGHNHYEWNSQEWSEWYGILRNNNLLYDRAEELDLLFLQGVALTMKSFVFGVITDLWGDAPYTNAIQGKRGGLQFEYPRFDPQQVIYESIIEDLQTAVDLFATRDNRGVISDYDLYFAGDTDSWMRFANSLLLRYYLRISEKDPALARAGIESVYNGGNFITEPAQDAILNYTGGGNDIWPTEYAGDAGSNFRRLKPCQTLLDQLISSEDPRLSVWIDPVHCQWLADLDLETDLDIYIRKNGELMDGVQTLKDEEFIRLKGQGDIFTRHYNPNMGAAHLDDNQYVGLPVGLRQPSSYNLNPTPGQSVENQHVSQLSSIYREGGGDMLNARLITASEVSFILAEASLKGWSVGSAQIHYEEAIRNSLETWGVSDQFDMFIIKVAYNGSLKQIMQQKWVSSWTYATESWFDFRRTGLPTLESGPAAAQPVLPVRFNYGLDELINNEENTQSAINQLEITPYSGARGNDSQWSKTWLLQETGKPW
ncbi:MAG: SusD/RagB family nutrient-binding outer membrane lipoprotein [Saprospiraceae bacterium]|nr:SusD/RagB family nutrient-binding outer membrane lipoprotein [Saprospiraceae bacterium]